MTKTKTRPRTVRLPRRLLGYAEVALDGPLRPGVIAHRRASDATYTTTTNVFGKETTATLPIHRAACTPPGTEDKPATACVLVSAARADAHGAVACTKPACWPDADE